MLLCAVVLVAVGCVDKGTDQLPIMGRSKVVEKKVGGKVVYDTIPHTIADFQFVNQDSTLITNDTFKGKVYVADFFFTSCPTICPLMKKQMLRVYERFRANDKVAILSHSIDPTYDNVAVLKSYAEGLGVSSDKWHFVTGDEDDIFNIGEKSYMVTAGADETAPGGYIHSGAFLLIDMDRRVRGLYDGTIPDEVDILMNDIDRLLSEYEQDK